MTPLHILIAIHYRCSAVQYEMVLTNPTRRAYAEDLVRSGMLLETFGEDGHVDGFVASDGLAVWIEAICSTPLPVQRWVIPERAPSLTRRTDGETR